MSLRCWDFLGSNHKQTVNLANEKAISFWNFDACAYCMQK
jgi:hypothetical protein